MKKFRLKITIACLVLILALGSVASISIGGHNDCSMQACCCMTTGSSATAHSADLMAVADNCPPKAPCCELLPLYPSSDLAVLSTSEVFKNRFPIGVSPAGQNLRIVKDLTNPHLFLKNGIPKAPMVPLYLQAMTFLC